KDCRDVSRTLDSGSVFPMDQANILNVPTLFGTNEHAVYNQLFAAFIAYVLLRWLYHRTEKRTTSSLTFLSFVRRFFSGQLPLEWKSEMAAVLFEYARIYGRSMPNFG
ncbi:transposase, IS4 family, partial [Anoxybacillus flavithermus TNO-09.006]